MTTPYAIYDTATGRIARTGRGMEDDARAHVGAGQDILLIEADWRTQYIADGAAVSFPEAPKSYYDWDWNSKSWVPNLDRAKSVMRQEIEVERDAEIFAPVIVYDGKNLDADAVSIDRLSKKLTAIDSYEKIGQTMPVQMLVWRDADNITHEFATHAEYKQWLAGLAVALDLRGTQAFAVSWAKKAELDAATTVDAAATVEAQI